MSRWLPRLTVALLLLCCGLAVASVARSDDSTIQGRVEWVYDGDTLKIAGVGKVRLLGIDTPEKEASERDESYLRRKIKRQALRETARQATAYLIRNAKGQIVTLSFDRERHDRFGRTLAYVTLADGRLLNRELLREGLALVYRRFDFQLKEDFLAIEAEARRSGAGVWRQ